MTQLTFGSLFAGIGGIDLGFERAGMSCKWQVEIDEYAQQVLTKHWPDVRGWPDVRTFPPQPTSGWRVDVIAGGFPCQDISYAGRGAGLAGERSGLFFEVIRVVRELRPQYVILENVAALLTRGLDVVLGTLAEIGYDAEWHCIPAAAVGAPHIRDRVFVIGYSILNPHCNYAGSFGIVQKREAIQSSRGREVVSDADIIGREKLEECDSKQKAGRQASRGDDVNRLCIDGANANSQGLEERQRKVTSGAGPIVRSKPERSEWLAIEPDVGRVADGVPNRAHRLRCLGNSVVPQVAELIGRALVEFELTTKGQA